MVWQQLRCKGFEDGQNYGYLNRFRVLEAIDCPNLGRKIRD